MKESGGFGNDDSKDFVHKDNDDACNDDEDTEEREDDDDDDGDTVGGSDAVVAGGGNSRGRCGNKYIDCISVAAICDKCIFIK